MARTYSKRDKNRKRQLPNLTGDSDGNVFVKPQPKFKIERGKITMPATHNLGKYRVPVAAAELAEDIFRLELMIELAKRTDPANISESDTQEQRDFAYDMLVSQITLMKAWQRYARRKLAVYLAL